MSMFAIDLNSSAVSWRDEPTPEEPKLISPGLLLASAINSLTVRTGSEAGTASTKGPLATCVIGVKSLGGSKFILVYRLGLAAIVLVAPIISVWPSGADFTTESVPITP